MQYLFDETGRTFIDAYNNVPHVGHAHPAVTRGRRRTTRDAQHEHALPAGSSRSQYADELTARIPAAASTSATSPPSGSEANELALRLARAAHAAGAISS